MAGLLCYFLNQSYHCYIFLFALFILVLPNRREQWTKARINWTWIVGVPRCRLQLQQHRVSIFIIFLHRQLIANIEVHLDINLTLKRDFYLCPLVMVLWLLQPVFLNVTMEKREKTENIQKIWWVQLVDRQLATDNIWAIHWPTCQFLFRHSFRSVATTYYEVLVRYVGPIICLVPKYVTRDQ